LNRENKTAKRNS